MHIGDSPLAADLISSEARVRLQKAFGDGGPGWHLPARPWEFYSHDRISLQAKGWKSLSPLLQTPGNKGDYGLQGIAFTASSPQAYSTFTGWRKNPPSFSRLEIHYQAKPGGGKFAVLVDGVSKEEISTAAEERSVKMESLDLEDAPHEITIRPAGNGEVTLFGVAMERDGPGVVYDSLGSLGASIHWMTLPNLDEWMDSLRLRHPHLVILNLGTNESGYGYLPAAQYEGDYRKIIEAIREALPSVSIMIMAPMDRGTRGADGEIVTMPAIPRLVEAQRRVALVNHCAFFNTYQAMGGEGTMARWYHGRPRLVGGDFTHPTLTGANRVGGWMVDALLEGFNAPPATSSPSSSPTQTQPEPRGPDETMILGELPQPRSAGKPKKCCRSGPDSRRRVRAGS
jgi:lysophospholipase L1-like esterase